MVCTLAQIDACKMDFLKEPFCNLYNGAKRVALLAQDNQTKRWYHIFSVLEILPLEIPEYNIPTPEWHENKVIRSNISSKSNIYSFYLVVGNLPVDQVTAFFDQPFRNNEIDNVQNNFFNKTFIKEPSGDSPLVLGSNSHKDTGLGSILPKRNSGLFVWAQIDDKRIVQKKFIGTSISSEMREMSQLTIDWLGFNICEKPENLGNIYLVAANPYFRDFDISLCTDPIGIFYQFKLRKGITEKFKVRVIDKHGDNVALDKLYEIDEPIGIIELPHEPHLTECRIYNSADQLVFVDGPAVFLKSIHVGMSMKQADFHVTIDDPKGNKEFVVEKFSAERPINIGTQIDFNAPYFFKNAENSRKHISNKEDKNFIFFSGPKNGERERADQKEEAKSLIRELINKARFKCYICDPYFSAQDLIDYAFYIKNTSVDLKIMNSNEATDRDQSKTLLEMVTEYNSKSFQNIEVRILRSDVLHDRFIVADNDVWFVGTSLNQIGAKATCIGKVPQSDNFEIIKQIESWYLNKGDNYSQSIEEYVNNTSK